ncbi:MAG: DUF3482 domain-containing protein [Verrucomicrobia bacterium]|nr:DUF3482 domain-containing protein [Verrucomicrobiota bacterium]
MSPPSPPPPPTGPPPLPRVPAFAVLGVVNEGKTSIVATLSEDPHACPDPTPGATVEVEPYTVSIDGEPVMRLYDTPGFQNAIGALAWVRAQDFPPGTDALSAFVEAHADEPDFENECRLLRPVLDEKACILYVVDGSAPLSPHYLAEMELLRLSGRRRLALINSKEDGGDFTAAWRTELEKHMPARLFNAHHATFADRLALFEALRALYDTPAEVNACQRIIDAFTRDWRRRRAEAVSVITRLVEDAVRHVETRNIRAELLPSELEGLKTELLARYHTRIAELERAAHLRLREIYKHASPVWQTPVPPVLGESLFSETTWQALGLTKHQLALASAAAGAAAGLGLDALLAFHSLGVGALLGGAVGGVSAYLGGRRLATVEVRAPGALQTLFGNQRLGGEQLQIGPSRDLNFAFILLDRALLLCAALLGRAHARRDEIRVAPDGPAEARAGVTAGWSRERAGKVSAYVAALVGGRGLARWLDRRSRDDLRQDFAKEIRAALVALDPLGNRLPAEERRAF